jgi:hypothetical protein
MSGEGASTAPNLMLLRIWLARESKSLQIATQGITNLLVPPGTTQICLLESSLLLLPFLSLAHSASGVVFLRASLLKVFRERIPELFYVLGVSVWSVFWHDVRL